MQCLWCLCYLKPKLYGFSNETRVSLQEGVKTENDHINLKVAGQDGSVVQFKIKRHTPLSKLMKAYCERQVSWKPKWLLFRFLLQQVSHLVAHVTLLFLHQKSFTYGLIFVAVVSFLQGLAIRQIRFRFDGQPINETDTPAQVTLHYAPLYSL